MKKLAILSYIICFSILLPTQASAWTATYLGADNWVIECNDGSDYSYHGSSAGLDWVGPSFCPKGVIAPNTGDLAASSMNSEIGQARAMGKISLVAAKSYPPHGYPCLGCAPCPGNTTEFCDNTGHSAYNGENSVVWSPAGFKPQERAAIESHYGLVNLETEKLEE